MKRKEKPCSRKIYASKYERTHAKNREWWQQVFDTLEAEASIPPYKRPDVLARIFPANLLARVLSMISLTFEPEAYDEEARRTSSQASICSRLHRLKMDSEESCCVAESSIEIIADKIPNENVAGVDNPYLKFFQRRPDRAAVWRELPPLSLDEMNLTQKAEAITEMIAKSFVEWLSNIDTGEKKTTLDVPTVIKMFDIGFDTHAARSLRVRVKELPTVTEQIATARQLPWLSRTNCLYHQIERDVKAAKKKRRLTAFGKTLPPHLRHDPPKTDETKKWRKCDRIPKDIVTMAAVWQDIRDLRSTKGYCAWLLRHPEVVPPAYLLDNGMINEKYVRGRRFSAEDRDVTIAHIEVPQKVQQNKQSIATYTDEASDHNL